MNKIVVSVNMVTFNHEKHIKQAIEGVLIQKTNFAVELIVSNDASTDKTDEIIQSVIEYYSGKIIIRYYNHKQNKGVANNFIWSLQQAKGKYIALCEGDDYWTDPLKLQKQVDILNQNHEIDICSHSAIKYDEVLKQQTGITGDNGLKERLISTKEVINRFGRVAPMASIMIRNKKIDDFISLINNGVYGVHGIMQVLWSHSKGLLYIPEAMSTYRVNSVGSVTTNILNNKEFYFRVLKKRIESFNLLNAYFKYEYQSLFFTKVLEVKKNILRANQISIKDKINYLRKEKINLNIINVILLITKSTLSKIKHRIIK